MAGVRKCPSCYVSRSMFHTQLCDLVMRLGRKNVTQVDGEPTWLGNQQEADKYRRLTDLTGFPD